MKKIADMNRLPKNCSALEFHCCHNPNHTKEQAERMIDYSDERMHRMWLVENDRRKKLLLETLITDYRNGKVMVGWCEGSLVYHRPAPQTALAVVCHVKTWQRTTVGPHEKPHRSTFPGSTASPRPLIARTLNPVIMPGGGSLLV